MKSPFSILALMLLLAATPSTCSALWEIDSLSKERAKQMGMEVRSQAAGSDDVRVELEFKIEGALTTFSRVDLRFSEGGKSLVTAPLREHRTKPGRGVVSFTADRKRLDKTNLWVMVPAPTGGVIYDLRVKDFVDPKLSDKS